MDDKYISFDDDLNLKILGVRLASKRMELGLSKKAVFDKYKIYVSMINKMEKGERVGHQHLTKYCKLLGWDLKFKLEEIK